MEDVLAVYTRPRDPDCPLVCLDETSKQLIAETRVPVPMKPGRPARHDYEYERNGTANLFMMFAPLEGWRHVTRTGDRPSQPVLITIDGLANLLGKDRVGIVGTVMNNLKVVLSEHRMSPVWLQIPCSIVATLRQSRERALVELAFQHDNAKAKKAIGSRPPATRTARNSCHVGRQVLRESRRLPLYRWRGPEFGRPCGRWKNGERSESPSFLRSVP